METRIVDHPLDVVAFEAHALIIVEEGEGNGKNGADQRQNGGFRKNANGFDGRS